jgi:pimeloyl-ACP methyl ester carboxylesterase
MLPIPSVALPTSIIQIPHMYTEHLRIPVGAGAQHVERVGRGGKPIVLLHGFGTSAFLWRKIAPTLAEAGFTTLAFDFIGYGESDRPPDGAYGIEAQAEYLDLALTALRLPKAVVVGHDIGALVALQLAARRPERVERLLLVSPADPLDLPGPAIRALQRASARLALGANSLFGAGPLLAPFLREAVRTPAHMPDLLVARYLAPYVGGDGAAHLLTLARSLELEDDGALSLRDIKAPTLTVRGGEDASGGAALAARMLAALDGAESVREETVAGAGQLIPEDAPRELTSLIAEWANVSRA